ncbi:unnamed protein product [Effrenium voratum]|uniref:Uncharacterized protein n=1 Tax=Effrenium voratum TaxID=2562239 RepID=A0AA36N9Z1_9DINO|nr:unnamed protein product [Effrenium voratum]
MSMLRSKNFTFYYMHKQAKMELPPFDAVGGADVPTFTCPLDVCVCEGCNGKLIFHLSVEAVLYDLGGPAEIYHEQKNCTARNCRASYGYNYRWEDGQKINALKTEEFEDGVLFVNSKKAFSLKYLQYHEELLFCGHLSHAAVSHAYQTVHAESDAEVVGRFHKLHATALFYHMAVRDFGCLGLHKEIIIDDEVSDQHFDLYEAFCHSSVFPPTKRNQVKALVMDGNQKLKMQCSEAPMKRGGRPRRSKDTVGTYTNGWMLACDPGSGRILSLQSMHEPENNEVAGQCVEKVVWLYPKMDCIIYDRPCSFKSFGETMPALEQEGLVQ